MHRPVAAMALAACLSWGGPAPAQERTAAVQGEVGRPGSYAVARGEKLSSLIGKAGGFTDDASLRGAVLIRKTEKARAAGELAGIIRAIEEATDGCPPADREARQSLLASLGRLEPSGRIVVRLAHPRLLKGSGDDLPLEDGDVLLVPRETETVAVAGAVRSPGTLPWKEASDAREYIAMAGGPSDGGDARSPWLLAADGKAHRLFRRLVEWNPARSRWEIAPVWGAPLPPIGRGDTIVVPRAASRLPWLSRVEDIDAMLRRVAEIAGTVVVP